MIHRLLWLRLSHNSCAITYMLNFTGSEIHRPNSAGTLFALSMQAFSMLQQSMPTCMLRLRLCSNMQSLSVAAVDDYDALVSHILPTMQVDSCHAAMHPTHRTHAVIGFWLIFLATTLLSRPVRGSSPIWNMPCDLNIFFMIQVTIELIRRELSPSCPRIGMMSQQVMQTNMPLFFFSMQCSGLDLSLLHHQEVLCCPTCLQAGRWTGDGWNESQAHDFAASWFSWPGKIHFSGEETAILAKKWCSRKGEAARKNIYPEGKCRARAPWFSWAEIQASEFSPAPGCRSLSQFHLWACAWKECMKPDFAFKHQIVCIIQNTCKSPMMHSSISGKRWRRLPYAHCMDQSHSIWGLADITHVYLHVGNLPLWFFSASQTKHRVYLFVHLCVFERGLPVNSRIAEKNLMCVCVCVCVCVCMRVYEPAWAF